MCPEHMGWFPDSENRFLKCLDFSRGCQIMRPRLNHALQRTPPVRHCSNRRVSRAGSLSFCPSTSKKTTMRHVTMIILAVAMAASVSAQTALVQSAEIVEFGIYKIELTGEHIQAPSTAAGAVEPATR